jgi:hypothetical protein
LIAALSGSAGIGAYPDKLQIEWIDWFEKSRDDPNAKAPTGDYVLPFEKLLGEGGEFTATADVRATGRHIEAERISW